MDDAAFKHSSPSDRASSRLELSVLHVVVDVGPDTVTCGVLVSRSVRTKHRGHVCLTKARCGFDQRIEHGLEMERRAANDLEHVGCGALLLEGLTQLVKKSRVLDGDHSLVGEGFDQGELLIGERPNFGPPHRNHANEDTFATHRHTEQCPDTAGTRSFGVRGAPGRISLCIKDLYRPVLESYAPDDRTLSW